MYPHLIRIGTRKSKLALLQTEEVRAAIGRVAPDINVEIVPLVSSGDRILDRPLADVGGKGLFTKELEEALLNGTIDLAVHSLKDLEWKMPGGLVLAATLAREDVRDVLVCPEFRTFAALPQGASIGTASVRRAAQLRGMRADIMTPLLRGNVPTRLEKIARGEMTGGILALAGLKRLGLEAAATEIFSTEVMLPAVGQGAIGIECRGKDEGLRGLLAQINHLPTFHAVTAERAMLAVLDGSCRTPIGGYAKIVGDTLHLTGEVLALDGSEKYADSMTGTIEDAFTLGTETGRRLKARAGHLLPGAAA